MRTWIALTALLLSPVSCKSAERVEREAVAAAVDRLRDAPKPQREARMGELDALATTLPETTTAKKTCLRAFRALAEGQAVLDEVQEALAAAKASGGAVDPALLAKLTGAETDLLEADSAKADCAQASATLHRLLR